MFFGHETNLVAVQLPSGWDIDAYSRLATAPGVLDAVSAAEKRLQQAFPILNLGYVSKPAAIVDSLGRIAVWYLPGVLPKRFVVRVITLSTLYG